MNIHNLTKQPGKDKAKNKQPCNINLKIKDKHISKRTEAGAPPSL
jgi:hypothetical protein